MNMSKWVVNLSNQKKLKKPKTEQQSGVNTILHSDTGFITGTSPHLQQCLSFQRAFLTSQIDVPMY